MPARLGIRHDYYGRVMLAFEQWNSGILPSNIRAARCAFSNLLWGHRDQVLWPIARLIVPPPFGLVTVLPRVMKPIDLEALYWGLTYDSDVMDEEQVEESWVAKEKQRISDTLTDPRDIKEALDKIKNCPHHFDVADYCFILDNIASSSGKKNLESLIGHLRLTCFPHVDAACKRLHAKKLPQQNTGRTTIDYGLAGRLLLRTGWDISAYTKYPKATVMQMFAAGIWESIIIKQYRNTLLAYPEVSQARRLIIDVLTPFTLSTLQGNVFVPVPFTFPDRLDIDGTAKKNPSLTPLSFKQWHYLLGSISYAYTFHTRLQSLVTTIEHSPLANLRPERSNLFKTGKDDAMAPEIAFVSDALISVSLSFIP